MYSTLLCIITTLRLATSVLLLNVLIARILRPPNRIHVSYTVKLLTNAFRFSRVHLLIICTTKNQIIYLEAQTLGRYQSVPGEPWTRPQRLSLIHI